jgi:hypothetical protein
MAKKKIEEEVQLDPDRMWSIEDSRRIERLYKVAVASEEDINDIYNMYKKYVKPGARPPVRNCKCPSSVAKYYENLLNWFSANRSKFEE